jgi:DNA polymerase-1
LGKIDNPIVSQILAIREHEKYIGTYYSSFLHYSKLDGRIHCNLNQAGTETGRFSSSNPNMQNCPKEDDEEYVSAPYSVRKCFIPDDDALFYMIDYDQMEYRLLLDYAGEKSLITQVNDGVDVHQATASMMGVSRKIAKTLNFMLLYGGGAAKLATALGVPLNKALELKALYFSRLPNIAKFVKQVIQVGGERGYIHNNYGRRCHIMNSDDAYILPNHLIQGTGADVIKFAMVHAYDYLNLVNARTKILLNVHDELLIQTYSDELHHVDKIHSIMQTIYKSKNGLDLTCSMAHSYKSWAYRDKVEGHA